tara:strand:- start:372 stop:869 length:498 start_codon:yes stop_codon:yes gene_type:complete
MTGTISTQMDHTFYNKKLRYFKEIVEKILELKIDNKTRKFEYVFARSCYYYLCRKYTTLSYQKISKTLNKNHATVMHGLKELPYIIKHDKRCNKLFNQIVSQVDVNHFEDKTNKTIERLVRDHNYFLIKNSELQNYIDKLKIKLNKLRSENQEMKRVIYIMADND